MKNFITAATFVFIFIGYAHSQNYLIDFAGSGASTNVDSVKVENLSRCTDTVLLGNAVLQLTGAVGITNRQPENGNSLIVFPNPSANKCFFNIQQCENTEAIIQIIDITGKTLLSINEYLVTGINTFSISGIKAGIYMICVSSSAGTFYSKIISINNTATSCNLSVDKVSTANSEHAVDNYTFKTYKKTTKSTIQMLYFNGERLKFTGYAGGNLITITTLQPTQNQTLTFTFASCADIDGNSYAVVQIGTQLWMAENLKTTHYRNGDLIPNITDNTQWQNFGAGARCYINNDSNTYASSNGTLYNGFAVNDVRGLAPVGWHCPSQTEFNTLSTALGGAGGAIKDPCSILWTTPNVGANNSSGFSALPYGFRSYYGIYTFFATKSIFWGTSERIMWVTYNENTLWTGASALQYGQSVRCIKD